MSFFDPRHFVVALTVLWIAPYSMASDEPTVPVYSAVLESGPVFENGSPEIRKALSLISDLASRHYATSEADVSVAPDTHLKSSRPDGSLRVYTRKADGKAAEIEFTYQATWTYPIRTIESFADKSAVEVSFDRHADSELPPIKGGKITEAGGTKHFQIDFHLNRPTIGMHASSKPGAFGVLGDMLAWSAEGELVAKHTVTEPLEYFEAMRQLFASLSPAQLDALKIHLPDRLHASRAYMQADYPTQHTLDLGPSIAGRCLRVVPAHMEDLSEAEALVRPHTDSDTDFVYEVQEGGGAKVLSLRYDKDSGILSRVVWSDGTVVNFEIDGAPKLLSAHPQSAPSAEELWLSGYYPDLTRPRLIIRGLKGSDKAKRGVTLWQPDGSKVLDEEFDVELSVEEIFSRLEAVLSQEQKDAVEWLGAAEEFARQFTM